MTTAEKIAVMQAYLDGKQIQFNNNNEWKDWTIPLEPTWNWVDYDFRIKPEEKPKRMTSRQLAEWIGKGNGEWSAVMLGGTRSDFGYIKGKEDLEVNSDFLIRPWGSDEWVEPTVDIYERDCKGN